MTKPDRKTPSEIAPVEISAIDFALTADRGRSAAMALNTRFPC